MVHILGPAAHLHTSRLQHHLGASATFQVNMKNKRSPLLRRLKEKMSKNYVVFGHSVQDPSPTPNLDTNPIKSEACVGLFPVLFGVYHEDEDVYRL
jgi:hypothetical protein